MTLSIEQIRNTTKNIVYGSSILCNKCGKLISYNEGFCVRGKNFYHYDCFYRRNK